MEVDGGPAAAVGQDLDVAPAQAPDAGAKGLANGLLGGKAPGEALRTAAAVRLFTRRVDAVEEALAPALQRPADARNVSRVHPGMRPAGVLARPRSLLWQHLSQLLSLWPLYRKLSIRGGCAPETCIRRHDHQDDQARRSRGQAGSRD